MANPLYGQNKVDNRIDKAEKAYQGKLDVVVAGNNTQYTPSKGELCRTYVNGNAGGFDMTLPAVSASDAGLWLKVRVGVAVTATDLIAVTAASGDLLEGDVFITKATDAVANMVYFAADESNDLTLSMNGSTTGGLIGSEVLFQVNDNGYWSVSGTLYGSGTLATPFS